MARFALSRGEGGRRYYPGRDAIGLQIPGAGNGRWYTVVGWRTMCGCKGPMYPPQPAFYVSLLQRTQATFFDRVNVVVRVLDNRLSVDRGAPRGGPQDRRTPRTG